MDTDSDLLLPAEPIGVCASRRQRESDANLVHAIVDVRPDILEAMLVAQAFGQTTIDARYTDN